MSKGGLKHDLPQDISFVEGVSVADLRRVSSKLVSSMELSGVRGREAIPTNAQIQMLIVCGM